MIIGFFLSLRKTFQIRHICAFILSCLMKIIVKIADELIFYFIYFDIALVRVNVLFDDKIINVFAKSFICDDDESIVCNSEL